jgi:transposase-like protein
MSSTRASRPHLSLKQRQRLLQRYQQSRSTQAEFAAQAGVGLSTLCKWLRQERDGGSTPAPVTFQEVCLPALASPWRAEIVSPQGWTVRLQNDRALATLPQLLRALPC